jgi:phosphatidylglycerophosphate synthase
VKAKFGLANALTALRLLLVAPMCWAIVMQQFMVASAVFCLAVISDLADGRVARARGEVSKFGGLFDHSVDATFVGLSLGALASLGTQEAVAAPLTVTPLLPVLVLFSFSQYALDSKVLAGQPLRASMLGRYNGIGYFVVLGTAVIGAGLIAITDRFHNLLPPAVNFMGWLLVVTTVVSMLDRFLAYQKVHDSP